MLRKVSLKFVVLFLVFGIIIGSSYSAFAGTIVVTVPAHPNGTTNPSGSRNDYDTGINLPIVITPNPGYIIASITVNASTDIEKTGIMKYNADGVGATYTLINLSESVRSYRVEIYFKEAPAKYTVTVSAGSNGTITPADPQITVYEGQTRKFTITPNEGYLLDDVKLNDTSVIEEVADDGTYTLSGITANSALNATFKAIPKEFTITATAGPNGTITPASTVVEEGETAEFIITPDSGYTIDKATLDDLDITNIVIEKDYKYPLPPASADHKIHVTFKELPPVQHKITASAEENGTIAPPDAMVNHGQTSPKFTITPTGNYKVFEVLVDGVSVGTMTSYTFENVTADHTISVKFHVPGDADASGDLNLKDAVQFLQIGTDHKTAK